MMSHDHAELCDRIVGQMPEAVILADGDGRIRLWNRGAEVIFGHRASEVVGESLDIIIPEDLRQRHWEGYRRAVSAGHTQLGPRALPTKAIRKDGTTIYVELSFAILLDDTGVSIGALGVGRDITERYRQQKAMRKRLAELEDEMAARSQSHGPATVSQRQTGGGA
jgi:PAS domain S-box-containing protein